MAYSDRRREAHNGRGRETSHRFSGMVLPRKTAECRSERPLPSLELVTHKTHKCCQTGAYHTLNKRGHIPGVFPHEVTSCRRGKNGMLGIHWGSAGKDTSFAEGLSSSVYVFFLLFPTLCTIFIFLSGCTSQSYSQGPSQWNYESWSEGLV